MLHLNSAPRMAPQISCPRSIIYPPATSTQQGDSTSMNPNETSDNVNGFYVPMDPMDLLQCDSCQ